MAKTKEQKVAIVEGLESSFKAATSAVFVHFKGLSVADETAVRRGLGKEGVTYVVAKKTLVRRALGNLGHKHEELPLEGELAVVHATSEDVSLPARLVHEFGKTFAGKLAIVGGLFEGALKDAASMQEIATIPPMPVLQAMFAQVINSPRSRFAVVLNEVAKTKN